MWGTSLRIRLRWALLATVLLGISEVPQAAAASDGGAPVVLAFLELPTQEQLHFSWQGPSDAPIVISAGPHAEDRVVYRGAPPHQLILGPGNYWIWSAAGSGTMRITSRRV